MKRCFTSEKYYLGSNSDLHSLLSKPDTEFNETRRQCGKPSRYIPANIKRTIFQRSDGRCEFIDENGMRCNSRYQVQFDHINPHSLGGENTLENLRHCCCSHNSYLATLAGIGIETTIPCKHETLN